jgi:hypothetical protein
MLFVVIGGCLEFIRHGDIIAGLSDDLQSHGKTVFIKTALTAGNPQ